MAVHEFEVLEPPEFATRVGRKSKLERFAGAEETLCIEGLMRDVMFEIPSRTDVREVVVTTESVEHGTAPLLVLRPEPERKEA